jgi:hypothetical protein
VHLPRLPFTLLFLILSAALAIGCKDTATVPTLGTVMQRHYPASKFESGKFVSTTARCETDEELVGGGYVLDGSDVRVVRDFGSDGKYYIVLSPTPTTSKGIVAFASCLKSTYKVLPKFVLSSKTGAAVKKGGVITQEAGCDPGEYLLSGGYTNTNLEFDPGYVFASGPSGNSWVVSGNATKAAMGLTAWALCAQAHIKTMVSPRTFTITAGKSASSSAICPGEGQVMLSGGYQVADKGNITFTRSSPADVGDPASSPFDHWTVNGTNNDTVDHEVTVAAVCGIVTAEAPPTAVPTETPTLAPTVAPTAIATPISPAHMALTPTAASAACLSGQYPTITVRNTGGATLAWSATSATPSVTISPASGSVAASGSQTVSVSGQSPGPTLVIAFTSNGGNGTVTYTCA